MVVVGVDCNKFVVKDLDGVVNGHIVCAGDDTLRYDDFAVVVCDKHNTVGTLQNDKSVGHSKGGDCQVFLEHKLGCATLDDAEISV